MGQELLTGLIYTWVFRQPLQLKGQQSQISCKKHLVRVNQATVSLFKWSSTSVIEVIEGQETMAPCHCHSGEQPATHSHLGWLCK